MKEKSHYLLTTFIVIQGIIFAMISILLFVSQSGIVESYKFDVFVTLVLFLFYGYMVHYAYHSIQKAYYIELIAFLIMSTTSSTLSVLTMFYLAFSNNSEEEKTSKTIYILGIVSGIILIIGNLVYFFTAYFSYEYFEEKFFEKLGARLKFHNMFYWVQFNNSMMKSDFGFYLMLLFADYIYDYEHYWFVIIDTIIGILMLFFLVFLRRSIRNEIKGRMLFVLISKFLIFGYIIYRVYEAYLEADTEEQFKIPAEISLLVYLIVTVIHLVLISVSAFKCLAFFGQGLKEALLQQTKVNIKKEEEDLEEGVGNENNENN